MLPVCLSRSMCAQMESLYLLFIVTLRAAKNLTGQESDLHYTELNLGGRRGVHREQHAPAQLQPP